MLNEGLHIKSVDGVILLRKTTSPIVYLQQIGRCLQVDLDKPPLIFDLVNNVNNIQAHSLLTSLEKAIEQEQTLRKEFDLPVHKVEIHITDETLAIQNALAIISTKLNFHLNSFEFGLEELIKFKDQYGNCIVPRGYKAESGFGLDEWVSSKRKQHKAKVLSNEQMVRLIELGFVWDALDYTWNLGLAELQSYLKKTGNLQISQKYKTKSGYLLGSWVSDQRKRFKQGKLLPDKISKLNGLGFIWDIHEYDWQQGVSELKLFKSENGHLIVKNNAVNSSGFKMGTWASERKKSYANATLEKEKIDELNQLGFIWSNDNYSWDLGLKHLLNYFSNNGDCLVGQYYNTEDGFNLGSWVSEKRKAFSNDNLSPKKIEELNKINFVWNKVEYEWNKGYDALIDFRNLAGNCNVPVKYILPDGYNLGGWVNSQMKALSGETIRDDRLNKLNQIGFVWARTKHK
jgi:hypothetical protein